VKRIAAEFYDHLPYHTSWVKVIWDFIFDKEHGPHARTVGFLPEGLSEDDIAAGKSHLNKSLADGCPESQSNNNQNHLE